MKFGFTLDFQLLYKSLGASVFVVSVVSLAGIVVHLMLSVLFASSAVFLSLFVLAIALGAYLTYTADDSAFKWDNSPRIAIRSEREVKEL